jgi:DnaJ-class molecular chaperone
MKYHPDHYKGDSKVAQQKTQEIIDAYRTLKDERLRSEYDSGR